MENMNTSKNILIALAAVIIIGIGAYWAFATNTDRTETSQMPVTSGENPQPGDSVHNLSVEPAAAAARADLALKLGVGEGSIVILLVEDQTWSDGCLGLGQPNESCMAALTPGFKVEMLAKGESYIYRTDKTGSTVRMESK